MPKLLMRHEPLQHRVGKFVVFYVGTVSDPETPKLVQEVARDLQASLGVKTGHLGSSGVVEFYWDPKFDYATVDATIKRIVATHGITRMVYSDRTHITM